MTTTMMTMTLMTPMITTMITMRMTAATATATKSHGNQVEDEPERKARGRIADPRPADAQQTRASRRADDPSVRLTSLPASLARSFACLPAERGDWRHGERGREREMTP